MYDFLEVLVIVLVAVGLILAAVKDYEKYTTPKTEEVTEVLFLSKFKPGDVVAVSSFETIAIKDTTGLYDIDTNLKIYYKEDVDSRGRLLHSRHKPKALVGGEILCKE